MANIKAGNLKTVKLSAIKPNPLNNNRHTPEQIDALAKIIGFQGQRLPITISNLSGLIVKGHATLKAIKKLGWKEALVDYQDFTDEAQEYAHMTADNEIARWSIFDMKAFDISSKKLFGKGFDFDILGIQGMANKKEEDKKAEIEDVIPEKVKAIAKLGQIYQLGNHRLMCGDSTSADAVEKLMNGEKAEMVFTDPPYGMNLNTDYSSMKNKATEHWNNKPKSYSRVIGDDSEFDPFMILRIKCDEIFIWGADYFADKIPKGGSYIVWDKFPTDNNSDRLGSSFELCWSKSKHKRHIVRIQQPFGVKAKDRVHPTQKPVELVEFFFKAWANGAMNILDLFGGSGSTLIACEKTNRKCFMMELDTHYVDVIIARWEKYTGKKAKLISKEKK